MNHYGYFHPDLDMAMLRYSFGMDSCRDREILRNYGGPNYWHLDGCSCQPEYLIGTSKRPYRTPLLVTTTP